MKNHVINKVEYKKYFDDISKLIKGQQVELEVTGLDIGNQIESEWVAFEGFSYDPKQEILVVHTPTLDHAIHHPIKIIAAEENSTLSSISISDTEDHTHIVQFRKPLMLERTKH